MKNNFLLRLLGSVKLTLIILAVFAVTIAVATFVEVRYGTDGARAMVYNARWFEALLVTLLINLIISLLINMPYRRFQTGYVITHVAFIIVLVSAGITRYFGYEGTMRIREGASSDFIYSAKDYVRLSAGDESASFPVRLYKPGKNLLRKTVEVGGEDYKVSILEYWPHFERRFIEKPDGHPLLVFVTSGMASGRATLEEGHTYEAPGVTVRFLRDRMETLPAAPAFGELVIDVDGTMHRLAVPAEAPTEIRAGDYDFKITEFVRDFRVGRTPLPDDEMRNPAIRVQIEGPGGERHERLLFAYHPDFDMGHGGGEKAFEHIGLIYAYNRNLYFFRKAPSVLAAHADFALDVQAGGGHSEGTEIDSGTEFEVKPGSVLRSGTFVFLLAEFWESAVEEPSLSENTDRPAAIRLAVEDQSGNKADAVVEKYGEPVAVDLGGREIATVYGPVRIALPHRIHLDDFVLATYPGSENPASFESHVRLYDDASGIDGQPVRIYMNHPLSYRGFKHFQSSYDRDRQGTILSVNRDPGKLPTYIGYTLVGLGFLVTLTRGLIWHRNPAR
ncbi:MAG: cytochrome c biogenesis protein ResB [Candidatus Krumholzibacteria bacterium]|nr:cytochrome c biogenesis protein ResB [Candidatus Krumholzibacteria bacterium]